MTSAQNRISSKLLGGWPTVVVQRDLAAAALTLALAVAAWAYGVYCYVQMVRHRKPGVQMFSLIWPGEYLTQRGLEFRRRALWSYAAFAVLALLLILLGRLAGRN